MSSYSEWAEVYDLIHEDTKEDIQFYLDYAKHRGPSILETACVTSRFLVHLAEAGYEVRGIE